MILKILHISGTYLDDGATSSIINLNKHLKKKINSIFYLLKHKNKKNDDVEYLNNSFLLKIKFFILSKIEYVILKIIKKDKTFAFFNNIINSNALQVINKIKPSIVHLHWIPRAINVSQFFSIKNKIVITLRDYWFITGGCNYPVNCEKFTSTCNACPHIKNFKLEKDISFLNFKKKREAIYKNRNNLHIVVPNLDMKKEVIKLGIFNSNNITYIPNGIEENEFFAMNKGQAKSKLQLNNKKIILFGSQNLNQEWKGLKTIVELSKIINREKYSFISFGIIDDESKEIIKKNIEYIDMGYISDNNALRTLYNAADFFLFPSLIETFGKVILESIFCHTPVIALNQYAAKDIISHGIDGFLVDSQDPKKFNDAIIFLERNLIKEKFVTECLKKIKRYNMKNISEEYIKLYQKIN